MNKYQLALDKLKMPTSNYMSEDEAITLLQELIDDNDFVQYHADALDEDFCDSLEMLDKLSAIK